MKHIINDKALKRLVLDAKKDAVKYYNHYKLTYIGYNIEWNEHKIGCFRLVLLFDNNHNERMTYDVAI